MRTTLLTGLALLGLAFCSQGQSGLHVSAGSSVSITPGTTFSVDGLALTPSTAFSLTGANSLNRTTTITHTAPQAYISRVFQLGATSSAFSGTIALYYQDAELNSIPEAALTLNIHNGTSWSAYAVGVTRDAVGNSVTTTGLSNVNLNEATLANVTSPLPLSWGPVTANRKASGALVTWQTYDEVNTAFFQVERSLNNRHWSAVGESIRASNTSGNHHYQLEDASVTTAASFYRIRQVDADGRYSYSPVARVEAITSAAAIVIYPNPVASRVNIQASSEPITAIRLYAADGTLLRSEAVNKVNQFAVDLSNLPKGSYWLEVILNNGQSNQHQLLKH